MFGLSDLAGAVAALVGFASDGMLVVLELMLKKIEREVHVNLLMNKQSNCRCIHLPRAELNDRLTSVLC
jgi:hypothetical protein